jgi:hypothetical protein
MPTLVPPKPEEELLLYIAVINALVRTMLSIDRGQGKLPQLPVYIISEILKDGPTSYPEVQKLLYVMLLTTRKFKHFFLAHLIKVMFDRP